MLPSFSFEIRSKRCRLSGSETSPGLSPDFTVSMGLMATSPKKYTRSEMHLVRLPVILKCPVIIPRYVK
jgi:hypothetical protein